MNIDITKALELALSASTKAGEILMEKFDNVSDLRPISKESNRDIYTNVDEDAEQVIIEILSQQSDIPMMCEERGLIKKNNSDYMWIIDALDGTVNYVHNIPFFTVSIALVHKNQPLVGVVFAPFYKDLYYAASGIGSFKNQHPLQIKPTPPEQSLFATSFSGKNYSPKDRNDEFITFGKVNDLSRGCIRTGSASLNLAFLAEGKINGCWGKANKKWDLMAGLLIAQEAGALTEIVQLPNSNELISYIAANSKNFDFLKQNLSGLLTSN